MPVDRAHAPIPFKPRLGLGGSQGIGGIDDRRVGPRHPRHSLRRTVEILDVERPDVAEVAPLLVPQERHMTPVGRPREPPGSCADETWERVEPLDGEPGSHGLRSTTRLAESVGDGTAKHVSNAVRHPAARVRANVIRRPPESGPCARTRNWMEPGNVLKRDGTHNAT